MSRKIDYGKQADIVLANLLAAMSADGWRGFGDVLRELYTLPHKNNSRREAEGTLKRLVAGGLLEVEGGSRSRHLRLTRDGIIRAWQLVNETALPEAAKIAANLAAAAPLFATKKYAGGGAYKGRVYVEAWIFNIPEIGYNGRRPANVTRIQWNKALRTFYMRALPGAMLGWYELHAFESAAPYMQVIEPAPEVSLPKPIKPDAEIGAMFNKWFAARVDGLPLIPDRDWPPETEACHKDRLPPPITNPPKVEVAHV